MRVIVACEYSARVRDAFRRRGHDAWSCDLLPSEGDRRWHIQGNVLDVINDGWDLMVAHPPCTYLCNSGVRWLVDNPERWGLMREGAEFFRELLHAEIPKVAIENPVMHGHARSIVGMNFTQSVQPWQFGCPEKKRTCLWLRGLNPLKPTSIVPAENRKDSVNKASPGADRWKVRSRTFPEVAEAMASQWG
jgi:hypothetical protein